jgi:GWxTD domain-containing protein
LDLRSLEGRKPSRLFFCSQNIEDGINWKPKESMRMRRFLARGIILLAFCQCFNSIGKPQPVESFKTWIDDDVAYIVTLRERDVYLRLTTDKERRIFMDLFWKQRDPTPNTLRNEFREEHYRRLDYADRMYGRGTSLPGRRTDRGRIYIVLGPPKNIESYDNVQNVYPTQIWFYLGDPGLGLPTGFNVIFFKKQGTGDYVLYSPVDDGPASLIADDMGAAYDNQTAARVLAKYEPNLARQTLTLIPGERVTSGSVSLASTNLIARVFASPQKKVEDRYADTLLRFKDVIEVEYTANYILSDASVTVARDASGFFFVHYSIEPKKISFEDVGERFEARFELNGRVTDGAGRTVFQFDKTIPLVAARDELQDIGAKAVALQDLFPLIAGQYTFDLLLKNPASKEFTSFSAKIAVPPDPAGLGMTSLLLGYGSENRAAGTGRTAFQFRDRQVLAQALKSFVAKDTMIVFFQVLGPTQEIWSKGTLRLVFKQEGRIVLSRDVGFPAGNPGPDIFASQSLADFTPGYYDIEASLLSPDGQILCASKENFEISGFPEIPRPLIVSSVLQEADREALLYVTGLQTLMTGDPKGAAERLAQAYGARPERPGYALGYARALSRLQDLARAREVLTPLAGPGKEPAGEVLALLGQACHNLGQYSEAVSYYTAYLARFGANVDILNFLGTCHFKLGNKDEAVRAWTKSLEINPDQEKIRNLLETLKKK